MNEAQTMTNQGLPRLLTEKGLPTGATFDMLLVEGGEFSMGGTDEDAIKHEKPDHRVTLSSFYLGKYPVTQSVWTAVRESNPSHFKGDQRPVENVNWKDAQEFIGKLNDLTGKPYRLPSEAEWEYAARGSVLLKGEGYLYAGSDKLKQVGWYNDNSGSETHEVGLKYPNELGLYDLCGNVWEWCQDQWHENYESAPDDGSAWEDRDEGPFRVIRGGSWFSYSRNCRVASRRNREPAYRNYFLGFRLALGPQSWG